jgi:membrane fusion protein (multidrug efflux system)
MSEEAEKNETRETSNGKGGSKRKRAGLILLVLILVGAIGGFWMWYKNQVEITTDDAFIESHIHNISPRVPGHVKSVLVEDNQFVHQGDLLVELDPADYQAQVNYARARLEVAKNETSGNYARVDAAQAALAQARARLEQAEIDLKRGKALFAREVIPKEQLDRLETAHKVSLGQEQEAQEAIKRARAMVGLSGTGSREALVKQRQAELSQAELNLSYARIIAPTDGYVTRKSVEVGNNAQAGQPFMAIVQLGEPWVVANYKESDLTHIRPGQHVEFEVDAYPGESFSGKVDSIMAGTGAAFSLLPPENATGNYVKVVQRVPVKIVIDKESDPQHKLRVGMSVVPTVHTGRTLGDVFGGLF